MMSLLRWGALLVLALGLGACAAAPMAGLQKPGLHSDGQQLLDLRAQQVEMEQRMEQVQATAGAPDASCANICGWTENICELGERICRIAERHPADADFAAACDEARKRCARAKQKASAACACES